LISTSTASFNISGLEYGRYQAGFEIFDISGNSSFILHEFYVDEIEFIISTAEVDIGGISLENTLYTSSDTLTITVKTVGAAFDVTMLKQTDMDNTENIIPDWDGSLGFGYQPSPFGVVSSFGAGNLVASQGANLNINGDKNIYTYDIKYSVLLDIIENYSAGDYESLLDFRIDLDY
jgi:hypothetical protein